MRVHHRHPALASGADSVTSSCSDPAGYCEQIATATGDAPFARHPRRRRSARARLLDRRRPLRNTRRRRPCLGAGLVPGSWDQKFDPTAGVPLANPTPGSVLATRRRPPWPSALASLGMALGAVVVMVCPRRRRFAGRPPGPTRWPPTSSAGGARRGLTRRTDETLTATAGDWPTVAWPRLTLVATPDWSSATPMPASNPRPRRSAEPCGAPDSSDPAGAVRSPSGPAPASGTVTASASSTRRRPPTAAGRLAAGPG